MTRPTVTHFITASATATFCGRVRWNVTKDKARVTCLSCLKVIAFVERVNRRPL